MDDSDFRVESRNLVRLKPEMTRFLALRPILRKALETVEQVKLAPSARQGGDNLGGTAAIDAELGEIAFHSDFADSRIHGFKTRAVQCGNMNSPKISGGQPAWWKLFVCRHQNRPEQRSDAPRVRPNISWQS
jgi:hypothetical protein